MSTNYPNVYVGNRYVPKIYGEWDNSLSYEGLSIVTYQGSSYTSKKRVPIGIDIENSEYWVVTGNYNAQVEGYRQEVVDLRNHVNEEVDEVKNYVDQNVTNLTEYIGDELKTAVKINDLVINVKDFGATGDGSTDDYSSIMDAFNYLKTNGGGTLYFPQGQYEVSQTLQFNTNNILVMGGGLGADITYIGEVYNSTIGVNGKATLFMGEYDGSISYRDIHLKNIRLYGGHKAQYSLYCNYCVDNLIIENVQLRHAIGFMYLNHCYTPTLNNVRVLYNTQEIPEGMSLTDWRAVHDNGLIQMTEAHGMRVNSMRVNDFGSKNIPVGANKTKSLFNIHGNDVSLNGLVIERSAKLMDNQTITAENTSVQCLFYPRSTINLEIKNVYMERVDCENIILSEMVRTSNVRLDIYAILCDFQDFPFLFRNGLGYELGDISIVRSNLNRGLIVYAPNSDIHVTKPVLWENRTGERVSIGSNQFNDPKKVNNKGVAITDKRVLNDGNSFPCIVNGFQVNAGVDDISFYVSVTNGRIINHLGREIKLGMDNAGWILRGDKIPADNDYFICMDSNGGVFMEVEGSRLIGFDSGKIYLAIVTVQNNEVVNIETIDNSNNGTVIRGGSNKMTYNVQRPTSGYWRINDIAMNVGSSDTLYWRRITEGTSSLPEAWQEKKVTTV